jgi:hypothetical protein
VEALVVSKQEVVVELVEVVEDDGPVDIVLLVELVLLVLLLADGVLVVVSLLIMVDEEEEAVVDGPLEDELGETDAGALSTRYPATPATASTMMTAEAITAAPRPLLFRSMAWPPVVRYLQLVSLRIPCLTTLAMSAGLTSRPLASSAYRGPFLERRVWACTVGPTCMNPKPANTRTRTRASWPQH